MKDNYKIKMANNGRGVVPFPEDVEFGLGMNPLKDGWKHPKKAKDAWDFMLPEDTPLYATRDGKILIVNVDSDLQGSERDKRINFEDPKIKEEYKKGTNIIAIDYGGGKYGYYAHLKHLGSEVVEGEIVKEGQTIGYSGNTGYSDAPHVHFEEVELIGKGDPKSLIKAGKMKSVPVNFTNIHPYMEKLVDRFGDKVPTEISDYLSSVEYGTDSKSKSLIDRKKHGGLEKQLGRVAAAIFIVGIGMALVSFSGITGNVVGSGGGSGSNLYAVIPLGIGLLAGGVWMFLRKRLKS